MDTKSAKAKQRYRPEDLEPRDPAADEAALNAWLLRNKDALNASARKAWKEFQRGEFFTHEEVMRDLKIQLRRRRARR
jgi:predicted transcriptional regulator